MIKQEKIDYNLIRDMELIPEDLLEWLDIPIVNGIGNLNNRMVRIVGKKGERIQISYTLDTFDRWANSVYEDFDITVKEERDTFINFVEKARS